MGRKSNWPGVEPHGDTLRIWFYWNGERVREQLELSPTPANREIAARLRARIVAEIAHGTFSYARHFPNSPRAAADKQTFGAVGEAWLELQHELAKSTRDAYRKILRCYWKPALGDKAFAAVTPGDVLRAIKEAAFETAKTRNNALSVVRLVFAYGKGERHRADDPTDGIEFLPVQQADPDPFTEDEAGKILGWLDRNAPKHAPYFRFAFATGMRTSEMIDLRWPEVDFAARTARVDSAFVAREEKASTKTYRKRDVELSGVALAALGAQKAQTFMAYAHVFLDPLTGSPYASDKPPRLVMTRALKALGLRHRPAYNTRHTWATIALMHGALPVWVARQLGHSSVVMTFKHYGRWIDAADKGREMAKVDDAFGAILGA